MKKHINIPVFIPHYGCPNDCVFCNQRKITGKPCYDKDEVINEINMALSTVDTAVTETELAFFGGSFTAIPENEMLGLLELAEPFLKSGRIDSIRLSTRPDAINEQILDILKAHGVKTIELGLQSFSDVVLKASKRGHTAEQSKKACSLVKEYGFTLIGQMMVGLPCSCVEDEIHTAKTICSLGCDGARIYPTVVFPETELFRMQQSGAYTPLTTEQAVQRSAEVLSVFAENGVKVIRIGLCANDTLSGAEYAQSYHPSVGELTANRYYLKKMDGLLSEKENLTQKTAVFFTAKGRISQAVGQKRANVTALKEKYGLRDIKIKETPEIKDYEIFCDIISQ